MRMRASDLPDLQLQALSPRDDLQLDTWQRCEGASADRRFVDGATPTRSPRMTAVICILASAAVLLGLLDVSQRSVIRDLHHQSRTDPTLPYTERNVRVPSVLGLALSDAKSVLGSVGFTLIPGGTSQAGADIVDDQNPSPGMEIPHGSSIAVRTGPPGPHEPLSDCHGRRAC
jgi:hypothetical protein